MIGTAGSSPEYPGELNISAYLTGAAMQAGWGERPAFHYDGGVVSYAEIDDLAGRCAAVLQALGIAAEQRLLIALPDAPAFVTAFLGVIRAGMVAVPINPYLADDLYRFFVADSRAVAVVTTPWLVEPMLAAARDAPWLRSLIVFDDPGTPGGDASDGAWRRLVPPPGVQVHDGAELLRQAVAAAAAPTHADEPAFWLYTSGSTGAPKAAVHLHHDIWVSAECWARRTMSMAPEHVHLSASKLYFAYGLGNSLHCPMATGGSVALVPQKPTPANMLAILEAVAVTHFYAVPSFYNAMMSSAAFEDALAGGALASLQVCVSAGETLPAPLCDRWMERTGVPLIDGIGSTELLHIFIANRVDDIKPGCSGRPIAGYRARVVDETGADAADDTVGDLWVRGDSACAGYWNRHAASKAAIRGEWLVTGDKYRRDAAGYYWYEGRADDMFKVHGQWVSPAVVESVLLEHPEVGEVAVVAAVDAEGLACGVAHVVANSAGADDGLADALRRHAERRLSKYQVPGRIEFRAVLPKTATGKIQRYKLRAAANR